jgi:ankyrin repeat protein
MKRKREKNTSEKQNPAKLIKAITAGDIGKARQLIAEMNIEEINAVDENGKTALLQASSKGHREVCELLIKKMSANTQGFLGFMQNYWHGTQDLINYTDEEGKTALHKAASKGHKDVCELLISANPKIINAIDEDGNTALHLAAYGGYQEVCELLINKMAANAQEFSWVMHNCWHRITVTINATNEDGNTALHLATFGGHKEVCKLLIPKMSLKAINAVNWDGCTALYRAASKGYKDICELLINKMSPEAINVIDEYGNTALHLAASGSHKEVCELLIPSMNSKATNTIDKYGRTALHLAAEAEDKEVCEVLIGNMHTKKIMELSNQSSNGHLIQKVIDKIVADFINDNNDKFLSSETNPMDFTGYQVKLLQLCQVIDRNLLTSYLSEAKCINSVDSYITKHYFTLIGVCKSINKDGPMSMLVNSDCMPHMLSYLAPHSLCPELFAPTGLSGESGKANSENGDEWLAWFNGY